MILATSTFASSPVQAAAGMAVLDVIESESLLSNTAAWQPRKNILGRISMS